MTVIILLTGMSILASYLTPVCYGLDVYKTDIAFSRSPQKVPVESGIYCPTKLDMDIDNPMYVINLQHNCTGPKPCFINFHIRDELQASAFEVCGDLNEVDPGSCRKSSYVALYRISSRISPLSRVNCDRGVDISVACVHKSISLYFLGLEPCQNFGKALVFMRPILYPNHIYYMDTETTCQSQSAVGELEGTIVSQRTLQPTGNLAQHCQLSLSPPDSSRTYQFCVEFLYVKFPCSMNLSFEDAMLGMLWRFDCHNLPQISQQYCKEDLTQRHVFDVKLSRDSESTEEQGFALNFHFRPPETTTIPTTTTTEKTSTASEPVDDSSKSSNQSTIIAVSVSVLVAVSLLVLGFKIFTSRYRPCCKDDDDDDDDDDDEDIENGPEGERLHNFTAVTPSANTTENAVTPSAPPLEYAANPQNGANSGTPPGSGQHTGLNSTEKRSAPPPQYDSLFPS